jgi:hypothetical protein
LRVELPAWQRALYDQMRDELVCEIQAMDGEAYKAFATTALTRLLRLSQLASNPRLGNRPGRGGLRPRGGERNAARFLGAISARRRT